MADLPAYSSEPFWLSGTQGSALLIHGFTGSPYELKPVGQYLNSLGYEVRGPRLSGHTGPIEALLSVGAETWINEVTDWIQQLIDSKTSRKLVVASSMGACLSMIALSRLSEQSQRSLEGLILYAPALSLSLMNTIGGRIANSPLSILMPDHQKYKGQRRTPREQHGIQSIPFSALKEFETVRKAAIDALATLKCRSLIILGTQDQTVDNVSTMRLFHEWLNISFDSYLAQQADHLPDLSDARHTIHKHIEGWL